MGEDRHDIRTAPAIAIELSAVIVAVVGEEPQVLTVSAPASALRALPLGVLDPLAHPTLERGLRGWVTELTGLKLGYVEQLYTFGERGRHAEAGDTGAHMVSIGYLALTRAIGGELAATSASFAPWYRFLPWEDRREGQPAIVARDIIPALTEWAEKETPETPRALPRKDRVRFYFGLDGASWDEERVLDRYELLYEAGLVEEARRDGRPAALARKALPALGTSMRFDHRRILATAVARLRAKLKYRPEVFEL